MATVRTSSRPPGIHLPAIGRTVTVAAYVAAIRKAKAHPDARFPHGLTCWWSCTGAEIVDQFRRERNQRITAGRPITRKVAGT